MAKYTLSNAASHDFEKIFEFGIDHYGLERALNYANNMQQRFSDLVDKPLHYPAVDHVRPGYRLCVYASHSIYYKIENADIIIVRILGQQDLSKAF